MIGRDKKDRELERLENALVEDILAASDDEILSEFKEVYGDPEKNALAMRALFEKSVVVSNKVKLLAAKQGVAADRRQQSTPRRGGALEVKRARLWLRGLGNSVGLPAQITMAARKESELSDADILSIIEDLEYLGVTPDDPPGGDGRDK